MIVFDNVSVTYDSAAALQDVSLSVETGSLCVLVGPSGSGKSTLMRLVNRLVEPSAGSVRVRGEDVRDLEPAALRRSIGYVIQSIGLFPHRTVAQNIATVPRLLGWPKAAIDERVKAMLDLVRLEQSHANRFPSELSGGQAQRVGLARALAADPDLLLMDEPFGAVDPITRTSLRSELSRIHQETGKTILLVTHDPIEALELATKLVVLRRGKIIAAGIPSEITASDADPFVRNLFGGEILALRRLRFTKVGSVMEAPKADAATAISQDGTLSEALARMVSGRLNRLAVVDEEKEIVGSLSFDALVERSQ